MDDSPIRGQRPVQRRPINRPEPTDAPSQEPQPQPQAIIEEQEPARIVPSVAIPHRVVKKPEKKSPKRFSRRLVMSGIVAVVIVGGWLAWMSMHSTGAAIKSDRYQAVFFTNGQVYFGKLHTFNGESMKLTDVYYLQTQTDTGTSSESPQGTAVNQSNAKLIKLGDEVHAPEDEMIILKSQIQFYENLKSDGMVSQTIKKYQATQ
ncbi:MAG: hypothetical protein ACSLEY_00345 [Candidatus Saccharimonadales bacterium]